MLKRIVGLLGLVVVAIAISTIGTRLGSKRLTSKTSIGASTYWLFETPREMTGVHEAYEYLDEVFEIPASDRTLRTAAVEMAWPDSGIAQIGFMLIPCRGLLCGANFTNGERQLYITASTPPPELQRLATTPLRIADVKVDVSEALAIAGQRGGTAMLSAMGPYTQVSLFLSPRAKSAGAEWEVRYDAWRDGKPLRYLVVRVDAQTGRVTDVSG